MEDTNKKEEPASSKGATPGTPQFGLGSPLGSARGKKRSGSAPESAPQKKKLLTSDMHEYARTWYQKNKARLKAERLKKQQDKFFQNYKKL